MTTADTSQSRVLVLGAYGLIGLGVSRHLIATGFDVVGFGRDPAVAQRVLGEVNWIYGDLRDYLSPESWQTALSGISAVVNCAGALQDGPGDVLELVHHKAIAALAQACAGQEIRLVQISAVGADPAADTEFMASKGRGDAAIAAAAPRFVILRPGLVLAEDAYGGTALLRLLAAFPLVQPMAFPQAQIQTIGLPDLSWAVERALHGDVPNAQVFDLVEEHPRPLRDVLISMRRWLGFKAARWSLVMPDWAVHILAKGADGLARLGWATPLRTTAMRVMRNGVLGDPKPWAKAGLAPVAPLEQTLKTLTATRNDRLAARVALLAPVAIVGLAAFWMVSGLVAIARVDTAAQVLEDTGWASAAARASVLFWAVVDVALGGLILLRPYARAACWGMIGTSAIYLLAASLVTPSLWADPLGPLVKILPSMILPLFVIALLERR